MLNVSEKLIAKLAKLFLPGILFPGMAGFKVVQAVVELSIPDPDHKMGMVHKADGGKGIFFADQARLDDLRVFGVPAQVVKVLYLLWKIILPCDSCVGIDAAKGHFNLVGAGIKLFDF